MLCILCILPVLLAPRLHVTEGTFRVKHSKTPS